MAVAIIRARTADADEVAHLIGDAFKDLAPTEWLVPEPTERVEVLSANFRIFVELALDHGEVHMTSDQAGVAVWFPRDHWIPAPENYDERLAKACGEWVDRFHTLDALFEAHHPDEPHHHLAFLAVRRNRRGEGVGSALLDHHHAKLDRNGIAAYLEASSPRNRKLYIRHGYQPRGHPFALPSGAPFWPMWRAPSESVGDKGTS
jgi:GNAT superfamily N-acetyltransferase